MPPRPRRREAQIVFEAISIEGGLLSPEWLSRIAQLDAGHQSEADYRIPKGLVLRDELGRYWRIAQAHWQEFAVGLEQVTDAAGSSPRARLIAGRFVNALLVDVLGFASVVPVEPVVIDGRRFPVPMSALGGRVPIVVAAASEGLDAPSSAHGDDGRRRSPFGLVQEFLNASPSATWGIVADGRRLRIVRDNASLTRPAWIEIDLARIFTEERYADFAAFWLLAHESRFGRPTDGTVSTGPLEGPLESWREAGKEEGTRAREDLRDGFRDALLALGQGFLSDPNNSELRASLQDGTLTRDAYFQQLLRLVYRLIFLLTAEERGLLHPPGIPDEVLSLYQEGYSLRRLRDRSIKRSAHDRFDDLWEGTKIVFTSLATGEPRLGLPALAGLFAKAQCQTLDSSRLENRWLLIGTFRLSWLRQTSGLVRVNWRDMGPEELGSVYESLLELVPQIAADGRHFTFAAAAESKGNARKTSGSYYTPDGLVQVLLDTALEPVVARHVAANPQRAAEALLNLSVVDPACGSGHFLLAAARRLASHVARLRADGTPSPDDYRHALREAVGRCVYGVDLNPMAVELCKVSLWMEAVEPGLPLTFLDSHIQCGNALLGTTPELMAKGIPDSAWEPIEGDDRKAASALKKRNRRSAEGQRSMTTLWSRHSEADAQSVVRAVMNLDAIADGTVEALAEKEWQWDEILVSEEYRYQKFVADAWCAAFIWPKQPGQFSEAAPTNDLWLQVRDRQGEAPTLTSATVATLAAQHRFFHWHLQFPRVFSSGGFDVVLGNPPWEQLELQEVDWFSGRRPDISGAQNAAIRKRLIAGLADEDPHLFASFRAALRKFDGDTHFMRSSTRFPLCARGRINTYAIFAEHNRRVLGAHGRAGFIVPAGIATDETTKEFFQLLVITKTLHALFHFENEERLFVGVNNMFRFVLMTIGGIRSQSEGADIVAFARNSTAIQDPTRHYRLRAEEIATVNPNTGTFPTFIGRRDADINLAIYRRAGVLWRDSDAAEGNAWALRFIQGVVNLTSDAATFQSRAELEAAGGRLKGNRFSGATGVLLPVVVAKMVHQFDHRFATYDGATQANLNKGTLPQVTDDQHSDPHFSAMPDYWVPEHQVQDQLRGRWERRWFLGWRDITNAHNERTVIPCLIPLAGVGHTFPLALAQVEAPLLACLYASLCSFALDYAARQKVGGTHLTYSYLKQLPVLPPEIYAGQTPWPGQTLREWIVPRVLELTYTAWDLVPFAEDIGYHGPPFRWDPARRLVVRCELDAAFFLLYGVSRDDADYILDTFPVVRRNDERSQGEYRTKRLILEVYDEMAEAIRNGTPYPTRLDPPPADPRVAHPDTRGPGGLATGRVVG